MAVFAKLARFRKLARPAAVLGVMAVVAIIGAVLGGAESGAALESMVLASEPAVAATSEATSEAASEATPDPHEEPTAEPTVEATPTEAPLFTLKETATAVPTDRPPSTQQANFVSVKYHVAFEYEVAPDGFLLGQVQTPDEELVVAWSLARQSEIEASASHEFGPRGIAIEVLVPDPFPADAAAWVLESRRSNLGLGSGELVPTTVGGAQGVRYAWSGAHEAVSVAVQFNGQIWLFTATYRDDFAEIEGEFEALLESVVFGT